MGYIGADFTWSRRLGEQGWVREHLDRALVSSSWVKMFPEVRLHHVAASTSEHCMLVVREKRTWRKEHRKSKMFRRSLSSWNKNLFGHVGRKISTLQKRLQWLEGRRDGGVDMEEVEETRMELNRMMAVEKDMWNQRSRNCWLKSGDRNTSFFHSKASSRHQRNTISCIKDSLDNWQEDEGEIGRTFVEYIENLFTSSQPVVNTELLEALHDASHESAWTRRYASLILSALLAYG
ncbi:uncharacterized protein LOC142606131 [Castanea sativa]|uniref:uncharacterized protein LOC142606131 n=1 Tax=Castanea sativa TaxID=21020 RepID=UPI003F652F7A